MGNLILKVQLRGTPDVLALESLASWVKDIGFLVLTNDRNILALARWQFPYSLSAEQQVEKERLQKATPAKPKGYNRELEEEFSGALDKRQEKWVDDSKDYGWSRPLLCSKVYAVLSNISPH